MPQTAIIATTCLLPDGHQFTLEDLRQFADVWRPHFLYREHHVGRGPFARATAARIEQLEGQPGHHALVLSIEPLSDSTEKELEEQLLGGFSLAFLGPIMISNSPEEADLTIGLSPPLARNEAELRTRLGDVAGLLPDTTIVVSHYHQHGATPDLLLMIEVRDTLIKVIGAELIKQIWQALFAKKGRLLPQRVTIKIERPSGLVVVDAPVVDDGTNVKVAFNEVIRDLATLRESRTEVSIEYDAKGNRTVRSTPLPPAT